MIDFDDIDLEKPLTDEELDYLDIIAENPINDEENK
jgi:hypothetical protein